MRNWSPFIFRRATMCEDRRVHLIPYDEEIHQFVVLSAEKTQIAYYFLHCRQKVFLSVLVFQLYKLNCWSCRDLSSGFRLLFCHTIDLFFFSFFLSLSLSSFLSFLFLLFSFFPPFFLFFSFFLPLILSFF